MPRFRKELLRDQGLTVGYLNGRYTAIEVIRITERPTPGDEAGFSTSTTLIITIFHLRLTSFPETTIK